MLRRRASETVSDYELKVHNGKLKAVANLEELTFRVSALRRGTMEDCGFCSAC